ncbi:hypothetical protein N431DRAFT_513990 [Stipitochalara longipes BDJ]|nr:hypothetical protein N431DRAFT_513990 [Stipitochalara longipes BDJ]
MSSKPLHSCSREQNTTPSSLLGVLESPLEVVKRVIGMITYSITPVDSTDATTEGLLGDQLAGNRTADAPNVNSSWSHSENSAEQPTLYQALQDEIYSGEAFLAEQLLQALSASDLKTIHSVANDEQDLALDNLPLGSRPDSSTQHPVPVRLYTYFHKIQEVVDLTNDIYVDGYRSMLCLVDDLQTRGILHYLVPKELEGSCTDEFHHINRIQFALKGRGDNIARTVALAGYWLQQCWSNHPKCPCPNLSSKFWPKLPDRVIDLTDYLALPFSSEPRVKVVETKASRGAYVALSYRWPKKINKSSTLSCSTLSKLSEGITACELLSEIQDACILTKGLGIQYLWVDALGPGGDWHVQAEKMASIYKNAVVTIAAVDETSLSVAAEETPFVSNKQDLASSYSPYKESDQESIYLWLTKSGNFVSRPLGELDNRGWVYQEQLLSSRIISLTKEGVFWDCLHHSVSSNRPTGILGDFSPGFVHSNNRELKRFLLNSNALVPSEGSYWLWRRAVQSYTKRKLTKESDRLIAFEGITRQMTSLLDDECILGIWKNDALRSLVWFVEPSDKEKYPGLGVEGPSWSWISVNSPVQYRLWHPYERYVDGRGESMSKKATILELSAERKNPLGFDKFSGKLTVVGALTDGYLFKSRLYFARRLKDQHLLDELAKGPQEGFLKLKDNYTGNATDRYYIEDALLDFNYQSMFLWSSGSTITRTPDIQDNRNRRFRDGSVQKIHCLLLLEGGYTDILSAHYCLVLTKHQPLFPKSPPDYYRIGLAAFNTRHICLSSEKVCTRQHNGYSDCMGTIQKVQIR